MKISHVTFACEILYSLFTSVFAAVYTEAKDIFDKQAALSKLAPPHHDFYKNEYGVAELEKFLPKFSYPMQNLPLMSSRVVAENKIPITNDVFPDSRIFYFRMPLSTPYFYLTDLENLMDQPQPSTFSPYDMLPPSFPIHLPITFTSNGKPSSIYKFPQNDLSPMKPPKPTANKPIMKPNSNVINLNKAPYTFNGKPTDIYLLQDSFNSLLSNQLSNFYP